MIAVDLGFGFLMYLFVLFGLLIGLVIAEVWRTQVHEWHVSEEKLSRCDECNCAFVADRSESVVRCPRCGTLCSLRRRKT